MTDARWPARSRAIGRVQAGGAITATKQNQIIDTVNETVRESIRTGAADGLPALTEELEIKTLDFANGRLECIPPGSSAEPTAEVFLVYLPPIYRDLVRGGVTYVYTDLNTRTASGAAGPDETQHLTPPLTVGEVVIVTQFENQLVMQGDGRMWAVDPP